MNANEKFWYSYSPPRAIRAPAPKQKSNLIEIYVAAVICDTLSKDRHYAADLRDALDDKERVYIDNLDKRARHIAEAMNNE